MRGSDGWLETCVEFIQLGSHRGGFVPKTWSKNLGDGVNDPRGIRAKAAGKIGGVQLQGPAVLLVVHILPP